MTRELRRLILEFARAEKGGDPYGFRFAAQDYLVRSAGGGFATAQLSWEESLLADLAAMCRPERDAELLPRLGELLRRFIATAGWAQMESQLVAAVQTQQRVVLCVCSAAAELYALPWELLCIKATGQHVGELPEVLLRYQWPETRALPEVQTRILDERILVAWSAAGGAVPAREHITAVQHACALGSHPFAAETDVLPHASCGGLSAVLARAEKEQRPIAVLHLLCHGAAAGTSFGLQLDSDEPGGRPVIVDAGRLRQLVAPYAHMVRLVVLAACDSGNSGALGTRLGSVAQALHRAGVASVVASRYPLSVTGSIRLTETLYQELLGGPASLETALLRARARLAQDAAQLDWASLQLYAHDAESEDRRPLTLRPYRGLLAFQPEHHRFFFGRDREIAEITTALAALRQAEKPRLLVVAGASGTGKSSVVLAGAVPRLSALWTGLSVLTMRPGTQPLTVLLRVLAQAGPGQAAPGGPLLLVVDQMEELFTHCEDPAARQQFVHKLWQLASDASGAVVVLATLRVDFLSRCGELTIDDSGQRLDRVIYADAHRVFVSQMDPDSLRAAITRPASAVGLHLEEGLSNRMVVEVQGEPGALPLLEDTLDLLWQQRSGATLTQAAYDAVGGVTGALHGRADALLDSLDAAEQRVARQLFVRLVHLAEDLTQSTRRRVPLAQLRPGEPTEATRFDRMVARLLDARLLFCDGQDATRTIEVAHEALIRKWQRLHTWVQADHRMLAELQKIEGWVQQCGELGTFLVRGQLDRAEQFKRDYPDDFPAASERLLLASQLRVRRRNQIRKWTMRLVVLTAMAFALLGWFGLKQASLANRQAVAVRDVARMSAVNAYAGEPALRVALLREFENQDLAAVPGWRSAALAVLGDMAHEEASWQLPYDSKKLRAAVSADCRHAAVVDTDLNVQLWDRDRQLTTVKLPGRQTRPHPVALSPDRRSLLVLRDDSSLQLWSLDQGQSVTTFHGVSGEVTAIGFSLDSQRIFAGTQDGRLLAWRGDGQGPPTRLVTSGDEKQQAISIQNGNWVFASRQSGQLTLFDDHAGVRVLFEDTERGSIVLTATLCAEPNKVATVDIYGRVRLWTLGRPPLAGGLFVLPTAGVRQAAYSPDGQRFAVGTEWGVAEIWNRDGTGTPIRIMGSGSVGDLAFSSDSKLVLVNFSQGPRLLWALDADRKQVELPPLKQYRGHGSRQSFRGDGQQLVTLSSDGGAQVLSTSSGAVLFQLAIANKQIQQVAFSPDGSKIVAQLDDDTLRVWKGDGQGEPLALLAHMPTLWTFSADGKRIIMGDHKTPLTSWSLDGSDPPIPMRRPTSVPYFSPDRRLVAYAAADGVQVMPGEGAESFVSLRHSGYLDRLSYSDDGSRLLTAFASATERNHSVLIWNSDGSGSPLTVPVDRAGLILAILSPDGQSAITVSADEAASVWRLDRLAGLQPEILRRQLWRSGVHCPVRADLDLYLNRSHNARLWEQDLCGSLWNFSFRDRIRMLDAQWEKAWPTRLRSFQKRQRSWFRELGWLPPHDDSRLLDALPEIF